jgi:hypothetical protein
MCDNPIDIVRRYYARILMALPRRLRMLCTRLMFLLSNKPYYYINRKMHPITQFGKGIVSISVDMEMAWAWRFDRKNRHQTEIIAMRERDNIPLILRVLERYSIPVTWAIVGHLFLRGCVKDDRPHKNMPRPLYFVNDFVSFRKGDWYAGDPCTDVNSAPAWYAPDLIESIMNSAVSHEIACHSFSHIGFDERYCPAALADAELRECIRVMAKFGVTPVSMVFPGNDAGHFDVLAHYGFKIIRWFPYDWVEISMPTKLECGLWAVPQSSNIVPDENWDSAYTVWRLQQYVLRAIEKKALCHLWFHPSMKRDYIETILHPIISFCAHKREAGILDIIVLSDIVKLMERREQVK